MFFYRLCYLNSTILGQNVCDDFMGKTKYLHFPMTLVKYDHCVPAPWNKLLLRHYEVFVFNVICPTLRKYLIPTKLQTEFFRFKLIKSQGINVRAVYNSSSCSVTVRILTEKSWNAYFMFRNPLCFIAFSGNLSCAYIT